MAPTLISTTRHPTNTSQYAKVTSIRSVTSIPPKSKRQPLSPSPQDSQAAPSTICAQQRPHRTICQPNSAQTWPQAATLVLQFSAITTNKFRQLTPFSNKRVKAINKFCCSHSTLTIIRRQVQLQTPECNNFSTNLRCSMEGRWMSLMWCLMSGRLSRRRT